MKTSPIVQSTGCVKKGWQQGRIYISHLASSQIVSPVLFHPSVEGNIWQAAKTETPQHGLYLLVLLHSSSPLFILQASNQPRAFSFCVSLQMNLLLKEYLVSGDISEAEHCLRDLEVPHFHHELVYEVCGTWLSHLSYWQDGVQVLTGGDGNRF